MKVILDIEANGLRPDKIWCIVAQDIETNEFYRFDKVWLDPREFQNFAGKVKQWVGHNFLGYDRIWLNSLLLSASPILPENCIDTLVVSRLINFARPGGHGLESWGVEFGIVKPSQEQWDEYDPKMLYRCEQDVRINRQLYDRFQKYIDSSKWQLALKIEHSTADFCRRLEENGFPFDLKAAEELRDTWSTELQEITDRLQHDFPPRYEAIREITPVLTKAGKLHSKDFRWYEGDPNGGCFSCGGTFSLVRRVDFDPASKQKVIDRLWEHGWKPYNKTEGHKDYLRKPKRERDPDRLSHFQRYGYKLDKQNLDTLPEVAPASAKGLVRWLELTGLLNQLKGWIELYDAKTSRIHGRFHSIGAWSHRCSHSNPNMANASTEPSVRKLWVSEPGSVLVGCDAAGIQLRILAHYMDDERFTNALVAGKKEDGTDPHTLNANALGEVCLRHTDPRDRAKTFIYAWLLGAANGKIGEILECSPGQAGEAVDRFIASYPGLDRLKRYVIPDAARRGYFEGLDGRYVRQDQERLIISGFLQNGEAIVMKLSRMLWEDEIRKKGIWYQPVNFVHDEWQTLIHKDNAEYLGEVQARSIERAGIILKTRCPLAGEARIGRTWFDTH